MTFIKKYLLVIFIKFSDINQIITKITQQNKVNRKKYQAHSSLQDVQILARLRLGDVIDADLLQEFTCDVQRYVGA